jgi:protocatechuate 3,4-dioxygenase, beta subunit
MPSEGGGHGRDASGGADEPPLLYPAYRSTVLRAPSRPPLAVTWGPTELAGPDGAGIAAERAAGRAGDAADLTRQHAGEPLGERIVVHGRVLDGDGRPLPGALVEIWQANAAGRYAHAADRHPAPLDPSFTGAGWTLTDRDGAYRFVTVKPGAYPWKNHDNAWRPAHIHFSVLGRAFSQRLVTQMYFPGDPLLAHDPIFGAVPGDEARARLVSRFDLARTEPEWALAYEFDVCLGGREATPAS